MTDEIHLAGSKLGIIYMNLVHMPFTTLASELLT